MQNWLRSSILALMFLMIALPLAAQTRSADDDEAPVWPTIRYDWPTKLSAGVLIQPPFKGALDPLLGSVTLGTGGFKAGVGIGYMGGSLATGHGVLLTVTRTFAHPQGADPHQTFVGVEGWLSVLPGFGLRVGPAFRVGGRTPSRDKVRVNVSFGFGF
jgi:hypothetical protein